MLRFLDAAAAVAVRRPARPLVLVRPHMARARAAAVVRAFPGTVAYAVKCNDDPDVLAALAAGGVRDFDVASIAEIERVRIAVPDAVLHYMNPVKAEEDVREALLIHGVRRFALDHDDELEKILRLAGGGTGLTLCVRLAVAGGGALLDLSGKFGAEEPAAAALLRRIAASGARPGLTFHVGSQCLDVEAHARAVDRCAAVAEAAGVRLAVLDVGGGFPAAYVGTEPAFERFVTAILRTRDAAGLEEVELVCEPGRLLAADALSVVARVEAVRPGALFLNDGVFGALAELKWVSSPFPMRAYRAGRPLTGEVAGWRLFGPTCDGADALKGPYALPADMAVGDHVEVGLTGAYCLALKTRFNGFEVVDTASVADVWPAPVATLAPTAPPPRLGRTRPGIRLAQKVGGRASAAVASPA
jgi:ornithine decarboxylase